ncbi:MAG: DUF5658 family protein [Chloroflexi bacterium]|nr:DUF5658 family protein [Chloroflexota bacterium]
MFVLKYFSGLLLIVMGSMDCLTTVLGTLYFGTQELNPLMAGLISTNLPAFVTLKLVVTVCSGLIFVFAEKALLRNTSMNLSFKIARTSLRAACIIITVFLAVVVINNIIVILNTSL